MLCHCAAGARYAFCCERGLGATRVGTVDDYQGQEERIIFISTTLTKPESLPPPPPEVCPSAAADRVQQQRHQGSQAVSSIGINQGSSWAADVGFFRNTEEVRASPSPEPRHCWSWVGSPAVLAADDNWRQLLRHCAARQAFKPGMVQQMLTWHGHLDQWSAQ